MRFITINVMFLSAKKSLQTEALPLDDLLTPPLATDTNWSDEEN